MVDFLVGTGGWAYFKVPGMSSLRAYSRLFQFVEVNSTFYEYPDPRVVENWRRMVPESFVFSVRCHQELTHQVGLKPVDEAYAVMGRMLSYCNALRAPFLVLQTPASYTLTDEAVGETGAFFGSLNLHGVRLVWEIRAPLTDSAANMMQDHGIVHCVDLSKAMPGVKSDVAYSRLFGKGQLNLYQFTDRELVDIKERAQETGAKKVTLAYHGARMHSDAARSAVYINTGKFVPATSAIGLDSVKAVLSEDAKFPSSKQQLIDAQGWKVVDVTADRRAHLSDVLASIPERTYNGIPEVTRVLEGRL